jgi:hypothetical protein
MQKSNRHIQTFTGYHMFVVWLKLLSVTQTTQGQIMGIFNERGTGCGPNTYLKGLMIPMKTSVRMACIPAEN